MVTRPSIRGAEATTESIAPPFEVDHVQMALVVGGDRRLLATIERQDLAVLSSASLMAASIGTFIGRTIAPYDQTETAATVLWRESRRRAAVAGESCDLLGLLSLRRDGAGCCSDESLREREAERDRKTAIRHEKRQAEERRRRHQQRSASSAGRSERKVPAPQLDRPYFPL